VEKVIMVACDLHDKTMALKIALDRSAPERMRVENTERGRASLLKNLRERAEAAGATRILLAYEASGLGYVLHDELQAAGIECVVLAPSKMQRSPQQRKRKHDDADASLILDVLRGHVLAGNSLPSVTVPSPQLRDDREITRGRMDLANKLSQAKTQIRCLLKRCGIARPARLSSSWTKAYAAWLKALSECDGTLSAGARTALASLLRQIEFFEEEMKVADQTLTTLAQQPRYAPVVRALRTLKGVGPLIALAYLTELGDLSRFKNRRQIGAYLGLVPSSSESGEASDRKGHITRQGPERVRALLCQAVWNRIRFDPQERIFYERLVARNPKHKKIAVVACMRRLGVRMRQEALRAIREAEPVSKVAA